MIEGEDEDEKNKSFRITLDRGLKPGESISIGSNQISGVQVDGVNAPEDAIIEEVSDVEVSNGAEAAVEMPNAAAILQEVEANFMKLMMGLGDKLQAESEDEGAVQNGKIEIGGEVSNSRVVKGDRQKVDGEDKGDELPINSIVLLPTKMGPVIRNCNVPVIADGVQNQKYLKGVWEYEGRDDDDNAIYKRYQ